MTDLEERLGRLRPRALSEPTRRRVLDTVVPPVAEPVSPPAPGIPLWRGLALAAGVVLAVAFGAWRFGDTARPAPTAVGVPPGAVTVDAAAGPTVEVMDLLLDEVDRGVVYEQESFPVRRVERRWLRATTVHDPVRRETWTVHEPRHEVVLVGLETM